MDRKPITGRRLRVAVVGCGRISRNHFEAIARHDADVELLAICETDPAVREAASAQQQVPGYDSIGALLAQHRPDVAVLATPSGLHPAQTIELARAGVHVMTEKPMATQWADGQRMVAACDEAGVHLFVVKQNRYNPTLQMLRRAVQLNRFGQLYMVNINVFWTRPQSYYDSAAWRGSADLDGGAFMNQASHYIDLLSWLIGPVESLHAYTATLARTIEVEDSGVISLRWRSGTLGSVNVTMLTYPKNLEGSMTVLGETGSVRVGGVAVNDIQHWDFATPHPDDARVREANYQTASVYGQGHPLYYANVIQVMRGEGQPETDGREGLRSLELLIAAYTSAREGRRVSLPLD